MKAPFSDLRQLFASEATTLEPRIIHSAENAGLRLTIEVGLEIRIDLVPSNNHWPQYSWRPGTVRARDSRDNGHTLKHHPDVIITEGQAERIDYICWELNGPLTAPVDLQRGRYEARRRTAPVIHLKVIDGPAQHMWEVSEDCDDEPSSGISPNGADRLWSAELHQTEHGYELRCLTSRGRILATFPLPVSVTPATS